MRLFLLFVCLATCHITSSNGAAHPKLVHAGGSDDDGAAAAADSEVSSLQLLDEPACPEIRNLCVTEQGTHLNEQQTLECVQTFLSSQIEALSDECQHVIWRHTVAFVEDKNVQRIASVNCTAADLANCHPNTDRPGQYLACLLDQQQQHHPKAAPKSDSTAASKKSAACTAQLQRLEWVAFSDFRLIGGFVRDCNADIERHSCGRISGNGDAHQRQTLSQGETLACLQTHIDTLQSQCHDGVLRLSEYQADNVKLDRQLFIACTEDAHHFCPDLRPGTGAVYKCLLRNKSDKRMSTKCAAQVRRRERLISRDYRVSRGLARACKEDIKAQRCRRGVSEDKDVRLAQILLCLEAAHKNGTRLAGDCLAEMDDHRRALLEDFRMSPELLSGCADDIGRFCEAVEAGGKTIHCLMERARPAKGGRSKSGRLTAVCLRALESVVKVSNVGEDWRVDPVLRQACKPVVDEACRDADGGDARVMSCLMEKLGTRYMRPDCEQALMQIQYFVARNYKLDPQLYRQCKEDAVHFCHAKRTWDDAAMQAGDASDMMDPDRSPMILPCLHRYAYHPDPNHRLKAECLREVKRVMRQRAISVDLIPEVEDDCLADLAAYCFEKTEKGEEMQCLQDNLERLQTGCKAAVTKYTVEEAANVELNPIIMTYCRMAMERKCADLLRSDRDEGAMMECLIAHKNDADQRPDQKCRAAIEHFQLTSLKSYHFTARFKEACRPHVLRFCPSSQTKNEVVECLSEVMRNDTLKAQRPTIPKECRQQVRAQLYQQRENIDLDPKLKEACSREIKTLCPHADHHTGQILECLQNNHDDLQGQCKELVFKVRKSEMADTATDYTLQTQCRQMIRQYCRHEYSESVLDCLRVHKDEPLFDRQCHLVVVNRMISQHLDYRYNPKLQAACSENIATYCTQAVATARDNEEAHGSVLRCLQMRFREGKLNEKCQRQMTQVLHERALNYHLNPLLMTVCRNEIRVICKRGDARVDAVPLHQYSDDDGPADAAAAETRALSQIEEHGEVEECLKNAFMDNRLMNRQCKFEVANLIEEARADIHVDPLLEQSCQVDLLKYCSTVQRGNGRQLQCLQTVLADVSQALEPDCKQKLERRMEMFRNAAVVAVHRPPEDLQQLYEQVASSPSRHYFALFVLAFLFGFFAMGTCVGRVTRSAASKNK